MKESKIIKNPDLGLPYHNEKKVPFDDEEINGA
jgi:hypothetical protein